jgi:hypothetical protein
MAYAKINGVVFNCYSFFAPTETVRLRLVGADFTDVEAAALAGPGTVEVSDEFIVYGYSDLASISKVYDDIETVEVVLKKPDLETISRRNKEDIEVINGAIAELADIIGGGGE